MTNDDDLRARLSIWWTSCSDSINKERADALVVIERLTNERDEARVDACRLEADARGRLARMCGMSCHYVSPKQIAKEREWDCFDSVPADIEAHEVRGDLPGGNP